MNCGFMELSFSCKVMIISPEVGVDDLHTFSIFSVQVLLVRIFELDSVFEYRAFPFNGGPGASGLCRVCCLGYKILYTVFMLEMLIMFLDST